MSDSVQPAVFITGTSSGIGYAAALHMKARGWQVFAGARKPEDLERLREEGFEAVAVDLARSDSVREAAKNVLRACGGTLAGLVNNAGYGQPGALEDLDREQMRRQFEVNVLGLQELTNAVLPSMIQQGSGRIVHISSVVGRVSLPFMGIYSASKFAVEALADAQRVELAQTGVRVSLVEPGPIHTKFSKNALGSVNEGFPSAASRFAGLYRRELDRRGGQLEYRPFSLPPEAVAKKIDHALTARRPRRRYAVTLPAYLGAWMSRLAPDALLDAILVRTLDRMALPDK